MTYAEQLALRARIREWCATNPASWLDAPAEFAMPEFPEGQLGTWHDGQHDANGHEVTWCRPHDVEFPRGEPCPECIRPPVRPSDIADQPHWERLPMVVMLTQCELRATQRCTEHDTHFDESTACAVCLAEDEDTEQ